MKYVCVAADRASCAMLFVQI